jgi:hypothetical protein
MKHIILIAITTLLGSMAIAADEAASPSEIIRGDVRFVLMSVGQTTIFANGNPDEPKLDTRHPVNCFVFTYLVEQLGDQPLRPTGFHGYEISTEDKPLALLRDQHIHYHKEFDYEFFPDFLNLTKPKVSNPKRAKIYQHAEFGTVPGGEPFDLLVRLKPGDNLQEFKCRSIRLQ